ncbi:hypothetical protein PQO03_17065 [Lentisphaera profundi]|uniref:Response regulatory domain-containing protein n=1 Tax=Lentisphaera profundi TaxID=1658616 RepID=A0ABY7VXV8_9BACT|nr:hypothetical protein [Lentisphaera profundi]WDE97539.1 hypothetical protein PQO03_17065 [Lentisphaera profundi]
MLEIEPNVVIIDDKKEEVKGLIELFNMEGIGTKFFNADITEKDNPPNQPYSDVNLIFLDLHFKNDEFDVEMCTGWIEDIIEVNTFYILVIWSKDSDSDLTQEVLDDLKKCNRSPYLYFPEAKGTYRKVDGEYDFEKLYTKIKTDLSKNAELEELAIWKKSIKSSSNSVIGHLAKDVTTEQLIKKLQKTILGHGGSALKASTNHNEKRKTLFDALDTVLISNSKDSIPKIDISESNINNLYNIRTYPKTDIDSKLNTWFHFKLFDEIDKDSIAPGLLSINNQKFLRKLYSIQDDSKLSPKLVNQFKNKSTEIIDVAVILTRPCDLAQGKHGKNIKLLSGIKITNPKRYVAGDDFLKEMKSKEKKKYIGALDFNNSIMADSTKKYEHLHFSDSEQDVVLMFDFRYVFSVPQDVFVKSFKNIKIFNKELLSEIQVEYSSYSSRLGITQII